jgi:predicted nucleotidyltransferase
MSIRAGSKGKEKNRIGELLTAKEAEALTQFKIAIEKELGSEILKFIFFGSRARGKGRKYSDLDILVLLREEKRIFTDKIYDVAGDIFLDYDVDISPLVMSEGYFNWLKGIERAIALDIEREGISL